MPNYFALDFVWPIFTIKFRDPDGPQSDLESPSEILLRGIHDDFEFSAYSSSHYTNSNSHLDAVPLIDEIRVDLRLKRHAYRPQDPDIMALPLGGVLILDVRHDSCQAASRRTV